MDDHVPEQVWAWMDSDWKVPQPPSLTTCDKSQQDPEHGLSTADWPPQARHQGLGPDAEAGLRYRHHRLKKENKLGVTRGHLEEEPGIKRGACAGSLAVEGFVVRESFLEELLDRISKVSDRYIRAWNVWKMANNFVVETIATQAAQVFQPTATALATVHLVYTMETGSIPLKKTVLFSINTIFVW